MVLHFKIVKYRAKLLQNVKLFKIMHGSCGRCSFQQLDSGYIVVLAVQLYIVIKALILELFLVIKLGREEHKWKHFIGGNKYKDK